GRDRWPRVATVMVKHRLQSFQSLHGCRLQLFSLSFLSLYFSFNDSYGEIAVRTSKIITLIPNDKIP
ncbi:unnamed protein product, partial [Musa textilis]